MKNIHKTAIIEEGSQIADDVSIGAYSIIGSKVKIGSGSVLQSHVVIDGDTEIGKNNHFYPFCSIGLPPQDLKYKGENSRLIIGDNNVIREHVTINIGTEMGGMETVIGNDCLIMVAAHIAHDCKIGNNVILANNATLAGHVVVEDYAIIGGLAAIHQFVRIGKHAIIGGTSGVESDVIPYGSVMGERAFLAGLNLVGLKRRGFEQDDIHNLRNAFKDIFQNNAANMEERIDHTAQKFSESRLVQDVVGFLRSNKERPICKTKNIPYEQ